MPSYQKWQINFVHIPKTAGSSIQELLKINGGEPLCAGHLCLNEIIRQHPRTRDYRSFTVIRDPIERIYSAYNHLRESHKYIIDKYPIFLLPFNKFIMHEDFGAVYLELPVFQPSIKYLSLPDWNILWDKFRRPSSSDSSGSRVSRGVTPDEFTKAKDFDIEKIPEKLLKSRDLGGIGDIHPRSRKQARLLPDIGIPFDQLLPGLHKLNEKWSLNWRICDMPHLLKSESVRPLDEIIDDRAQLSKIRRFYALEYKINELIPLI
jgi:hypothetical protein